MLNIGQLLYPIKEGQSLSPKVNERLQQYLAAESAVFARYSSLQNYISSALHDKSNQCEESSLEFRYYINMLNSVLNDCLEMDNGESLTCEKAAYFCQIYINQLSTPDNADNLQHVYKSLDEVKTRFTKQNGYSFSGAARLLNKKKLIPEDMREILKNLYFGRDYLNISTIIKIRAYILNHFSELSPVPQSIWKKNPGNTFMGLIFSDMPIFKGALFFFSEFMTNNEFKKYDFSIGAEEEQAVEHFNFVLLLAYFKYLIGAFIFLIQCDYSGFFDDKGVEKWLLKVYRQYGFTVLTSIYKSFSTVDMMYAVSMILLDDICTCTASNFTQRRLNEARSMASALSRDVAIEDFSVIIDKICNSAVQQWEAGSKLDHISMIETFKKNRKCAKYFKKKGFERQLRSNLLEVMRAKGLHFIWGEDVYKRTGDNN